MSPPHILVPPAWVEGRLGAPGLSVVDLREPAAYAEVHLPGAVHLDLARLGTSGEARDNVLLPATAFADLMASLGVANDQAVVAYDDQWGLAAARLVWALHFYGHDQAGVLDGGWDRWRDEGRPATDRIPPVGTGRFEPHVCPDVGAELEWLSGRVGDDDLALLDTRTPAEYEQGHLPGAICWDWFNAVPPGSWDVARDPGELRSEWAAVGVTPERDVVVYCRSGMRAAHTWVALRHAGFRRVRLYDGSWQEWSVSGQAAARG